MSSVRLASLLSAILLAFSFSQSSADVIVEQQSRDGGRVILLRPSGVSSKTASTTPVSLEVARATADAFLIEHGARYGLANPAAQLELIDERSDQEGLTRIVYRQRHEGLPVKNTMLLVHVNAAGEVYFSSADVTDDLPASAMPAVSVDDALAVAERAARQLLPGFDGVAAAHETPELVFLPLGLNPSIPIDETRLAWEFHMSFHKCRHDVCPAFGAYVAVEAHSGKVLYTLEDWQGLDRRAYDCSKAVGDIYCYIDSPGINGYVHGRSESAPLRGPHNVPALPQFGSTDVDNIYDIAETVHDFVQMSFGIDGASNQGGIRAKVGEYGQTRYYVHSEGWDGQQDPTCPGGAWISGSNSIVLCHNEIYEDVVGHEYGHAIVDWSFTSAGFPIGVDIFNAETRAFDESFSDIFGEALEFDQVGAADWLAGSGRVGGPIRDLAHPDFLNDAERFYDPNFDCSSDPATAGYYANSTVYSKAVYLASEGGEFNGCEVQGQGIEFAKQVYFRAWRNYFSSSQNFDGAYTKLMQSCNDLYPASQCAEFDKALQAVEANQAEAPYGGGICVDPLGAAGEQAPACAVAHGGTAQTTMADATPSVSFQAGEPVWLALTSGTPNRTVDFVLASHDSARPIWDDLDAQALEASSGTLDSTGALTAYFFTPTTEDTFDVIVDGNRDGNYQPWADETVTIVVSGFATDVPEGAVPSARVLQSVRPNPFNPATNFSLRLRETSRLRLTIYDTAGRAVRTLANDNALAPGDYDFTWDGTGDSGAPVASGLYLYRIETARGSEFGKITLVK